MSYDPEFKRHVMSEYAIEWRRFERHMRSNNMNSAIKAFKRADALATIITLWGMNDEGIEGPGQSGQTERAGA
jgi:hypothetical protein